jgi:hypothetical protein
MVASGNQHGDGSRWCAEVAGRRVRSGPDGLGWASSRLGQTSNLEDRSVIIGVGRPPRLLEKKRGGAPHQVGEMGRGAGCCALVFLLVA